MRPNLSFSVPSPQTLAYTDTAAFKQARRAPTPPAAFGKDTFEAEVGREGTRYFSRIIHWPNSRGSGVTIGPGYDMGRRSAQSIVYDLTRAGIPSRDALFFSYAAGLRGPAAQSFVTQRRNGSPTISAEAQQRIFSEILTPAIVGDIKRILNKPDTVRAYGAVSWDHLPTAAQELLFDLRYRGDYTPATRKLLQPALVAGDFPGLVELMENKALWRSFGVPEQRIETRIKIARRILTDSDAG